MHVMTASVGAPKLAVYAGAATQRRAAPARMMAAAVASKPGQLRRRQLQATPLRRGVAAARCIAPRRVMTCSADAEAVKAAVATLGEQTKGLLSGSSVYLVGMMGSGKSSVAKVLGESLKYTVLDSDAVLEQLTKMTVAEIFEAEGEEAFRDVETQVLQEICAYTKVVVSTGGGTVNRKANWAHMQSGIVVYLCYPGAILAQRIVADGVENRPLLKGVEPTESAVEKHLQEIFKERAKMYAQADITVNINDDITVDQVALRVLTELKSRLEEDDQATKLKKAPEKDEIQIDGLDADGKLK